jgi:hypothetical protein
MAGRLGVRRLTEAEYERWSALVCASSLGSVYASPAYLEALCSATGGRFQILGVWRGDELVGGAALYEEARAYGLEVAARPFAYYRPIVLRDYATRYPSERISRQLETLSALAERLNQLPHARLVLHTHGVIDARPFLLRSWQARPSYTYVVPIRDREAAWQRLDQNLRRLIGRCESEGIVLSEDDDAATLHRLHEQVHERKEEAPVYLRAAEFCRFALRLRAAGLARVFHARRPSGESVAAQLVLTGPFKVAHTVCAGAEQAALKLGATPFLRWSAFCALAQLGYAANDLTDAGLGTVTQFKSQLGGELVANTVLTRPDRLAYRAYAWACRGWSAAIRAARASRENVSGP